MADDTTIAITYTTGKKIKIVGRTRTKNEQVGCAGLEPATLTLST